MLKVFASVATGLVASGIVRGTDLTVARAREYLRDEKFSEAVDPLETVFTESLKPTFSTFDRQ